MLEETERAKPPGDNQHKKQDRLPDGTEAPTLAELGVTKRESAEAQLLAELSAEDFEQERTDGSTFVSSGCFHRDQNLLYDRGAVWVGE